MRPSTLLALALPTLILAKPDGSLQALLERVSTSNTKAAIAQQAKRSVVDAEDATRRQRALVGDAEDSEHPAEKKRWVWGTSIIQDDSPTSGLPPVGVNANLLSGNSIPVNTPKATLVPPTFAPLELATPVVGAALAGEVTPTTAPASSRSRKHRNPKTAASTAVPLKRWVIGNSIIQDDSPTSGLPAVGVNVNLLSSGAADVATPTAKLVAPTFPPLTDAAIPTVAALATASPVSVAAARAKKHHGARDHDHVKKWYRGASIIQDGDPAPVQHETPQASLVIPTFPPLVLSSSINPTSVASVLAGLMSAAPSGTPAPSNFNAAEVYVALAAANRAAVVKLNEKSHTGHRERSDAMKRVKRVYSE